MPQINFGFGKKYELDSGKTANLYGRYTFNHFNTMKADMGVYKYGFDSRDSSRIRVGFRVENSSKSKKSNFFYGMAFEHEFNGITCGKVNGTEVEPVGLKGDNGILEVGYKWTRGNWDYEFSAEGSCGKRKGVSGNFAAFYNF